MTENPLLKGIGGRPSTPTDSYKSDNPLLKGLSSVAKPAGVVEEKPKQLSDYFKEQGMRQQGWFELEKAGKLTPELKKLEESGFAPPGSAKPDIGSEGIVKNLTNSITLGVNSLFNQGKNYFTSTLPQQIAGFVKENTKSLRQVSGYTPEQETKIQEAENKLTAEAQDKYKKNNERFDKWLVEHPELQPKKEWKEGVSKNPSILKDPDYWAYTIGSAIPYLVGVMGTTASVTAVTKNPILGISAGMAVATPVVTQDLYDDLVENGATNEQALNLSGKIGPVISAVEVLSDIPILKSLGLSTLLTKEIQKEAVKEVVKLSTKKAVIGGAKKFITVELAETVEEVVQQTIQNATVKVVNNNRSLFENLSETAIQSAISVLPLGIFGGAMDIRNIGRPTVQGQTEPMIGGIKTEEKPPEEIVNPLLKGIKIAEKTKPEQTDIASKITENIRGYQSFGGVGVGTESPNAYLRDLNTQLNTPEGATIGKKSVDDAIARGEIKVDSDGQITLYRVGEVSDKNPLVSATYDKSFAESFDRTGKAKITEIKVKPEDIKYNIGGVEKEVLIPKEIAKPEIESPLAQETIKKGDNVTFKYTNLGGESEIVNGIVEESPIGKDFDFFSAVDKKGNRYLPKRTDIIAPSENILLEEARKYKSAEEFVNGYNKKMEGFDPFGDQTKIPKEQSQLNSAFMDYAQKPEIQKLYAEGKINDTGVLTDIYNQAVKTEQKPKMKLGEAMKKKASVVKTKSLVQGKEIRETILTSKTPIKHQPGMENKVGLPSRGFELERFSTNPGLLGLFGKGMATDSFVLLIDKDASSQLLEDYIKKENTKEKRKLVSMSASEKEINNFLSENEKRIRQDVKDKKDEAPVVEDILPKVISKNVPEIIGYDKLTDFSKNIIMYLKHGETTVAISADKYAFIKKYLPDAELRITDKEFSPVQIVVNGKLKGLVMPIKQESTPSNFTDIDSAKTEELEEPDIKEGDGGSLGFNPKNLEDLDSPKAVKETDKIIKRSEIAKQLSEKLGVPIRNGKFSSRGAIGIFKKMEEIIRIKKGGLPTIFHEIGHFLDQNFKLSDSINKTEREALMTEYGYSYKGWPKKQRQEAFAEFLRFIMTGQEAKAQKLAPEFFARYEGMINNMPEIRDVLETARQDYARWKEMPATAKILSHISLDVEKKGSLVERMSGFFHNSYTALIDDLHPLREFTNLAGKIPAQSDPYILARNLRGWVGKADTFLTKGTFGKDYWEVVNGKVKPIFKGKSFQEIVKPISDNGKLNDFRVYLVSLRIIELSNRGKTTGISKDIAEKAIEELEPKNPEFKTASEELYSYQDDLLKYAMDNGSMGPKGYAKIKEKNKYRVPFYRVMEYESSRYMGGKKIGGNIGSPIKRLKGSEREIIDPLEGIIKDTYAIINATERNNVGIAMARLAKQDKELARLFEQVAAPMKPTTVNIQEIIKVMNRSVGLKDDTQVPDFPEMADIIATIFRPTQDKGPNMLNVNFGDKTLVFQVDPELFNAIQGLNEEDVGMVLRLLAMPAKMLRAGATLTPDFSVRNPIRDQFSAFVYSKYGFKPGIDLISGIMEMFKRGDVYDLWRMAGGQHAMMVSMDRTKLQQNLKDLTSGKLRNTLKYVKNPIEALRIVSEIGEEATRLAEMKNTLRKSKNPVESAFASREVTLDFARKGSKTKALNLIIAFWNANVQGTDKMIRSFKEAPFRTLTKTLLGITLPSILLYLVNRKDPRYKELPQWQKDLFWIVLTKPGKIKMGGKEVSYSGIWRIPKPFELGIIFGSIPERILESIDNNDPQAIDQLWQSVANGASPGFIPTALIPIIENITNYSFFLDRPIVSEGKQGLPPEYQANTYTSETAKVIGETLGYSPAKLDNLIQGYTGGLGRYAINGLDNILKGTGLRKVPTEPAKTLEDWPVLKAFLIRPPYGSGSESVNRVYNMYDKVSSYMQYTKKMLNNGDTDRAKEFVKDHKEIVYSQLLTGVISHFSDINKAIEEIKNSKILSAETKQEKILELQKLETTLAQKVLEEIKNAK